MEALRTVAYVPIDARLWVGAIWCSHGGGGRDTVPACATIHTGGCQALINVVPTSCSCPPSCAVAGEVSNPVSAGSSILAGGRTTLVNVDVTIGTSVSRGASAAVGIGAHVGACGTILTGGHMSTNIVVNLAETARVAGVVADTLTWQIAGGPVCA